MADSLKLGMNTGYWAGGPPPGIAESIAAAERLGITEIATLDRRHFGVVRPAHVVAFELIP